MRVLRDLRLEHPAAIDHHAPKAQVQVLLNDGFEAPGLYNVRERETVEISDRGYHWLMFDWKNWLLVCERCNSGWKRALFPLREDEDSESVRVRQTIYRLAGIEAAKAACPDASCRPNRRRKVTPLLLGPFGPEDPVEHLEFTSLGDVVPRSGSEHGQATIRTCGLHRESLRKARQSFAEDAFRHSERLLWALRDNDLDKARAAVEDLLSLGAENRPHAGMVRSVVLSRLGYRWRDIENLAKKLAIGLA